MTSGCESAARFGVASGKPVGRGGARCTDAARQASENIQSPDPDALTIDEVEVREVVANA
jgi:hypothetical protein